MSGKVGLPYFYFGLVYINANTYPPPYLKMV